MCLPALRSAPASVLLPCVFFRARLLTTRRFLCEPKRTASFALSAVELRDGCARRVLLVFAQQCAPLARQPFRFCRGLEAETLPGRCDVGAGRGGILESRVVY